MHILGLVAENYKRLRVVEINPKGRVIQITGKNGQGKTSVLDAIWAVLVGSKAIPEKPVRKGAEKARIKLDLGEFMVTRVIKPDGSHTLTVENAKGTKVGTPQAILDELLGQLTFDPLAFVGLKPKQQVEMLRTVAKLDLDIDKLNELSAADYATRTDVNRDIKRLETEVATITVQDGLPKEKSDEAAVLAQIGEANSANMKAGEALKAKQKLSDHVAAMRRTLSQHVEFIAEKEQEIAEFRRKIEVAEKTLELSRKQTEELQAAVKLAEKNHAEAPTGDLIDVAALTQELQRIQLVNREIDKRSRREQKETELKGKRREADNLTRAMEVRQEAKTAALQNAQMPVKGLSFDENQVIYNGIPLEQLGEAEQIRISTSIAMAANPKKLRIMRILHGEALDDDSLKILAEMAEANDFQIWMAKVDSSGKVGIVMEDGLVKAEE